LALAAVAEGRRAMMLGNYGGTIRGGLTEGTVVVAEGTLRSPPIIPSAWAGFVMSTQFWNSTRARLRPGGPVVTNSALLPAGWVDGVRGEGFEVFAIPADGIATDLGAPLGAGFVLLGAFCAITGIAGAGSLIDAMKRQVPVYRKAHLAANETAIAAGFAAGPPLAAPAFGCTVHTGVME
jgi:2-oxoglutarate ferredoxin oxidoreductase subunit gamma